MAQAFLKHSRAFTTWFDAREDSLPAEALLRVTFDAADQPRFEVIRMPDAEPLLLKQKLDTPLRMLARDESGKSLSRVFQIPETGTGIAEPEPVTQPREFRCEVCKRLCGTAVGLGSHRRVHRDQTPPDPSTKHGSDIDQTTPQKATHDMPALTHQTAPTDTAGRVEDPVAVLHRVREALGPDPRVTQLEARVAELQTEVMQQKQRADEASARLALIQGAFHA
ncbi:hypothetical protein [Streptomyces sp. NPDC088141]|uniref:hypothetical protein n=1 Tax=unclassified Streptomyces TaxID=2593676 RepID=UPI00343FC80C